MEGNNVQTEADIADKNEAGASNENEPISKKIKLDDQTDKDPESETDTSKVDLFEIIMSWVDVQPSSSKSESTSKEESTSAQPSDSPKHEPDSMEKDNDSDDGDNEQIVGCKYTEGFNFPLDQDASDMLDEIELEGREFPSITQRYFTPYYQLNVTQPGDDQCVLIHTNRICMFTLAPSHLIFQENKNIVKCDYKVSDKLDRLKNKVSGKGKHGAQPLQNNSNLCRLTCDDGTIYTVKCCIIGKLVEVNERLVDNPQLLKQLPEDGGYIALALPNLKHFDKIKKSLLDEKQYAEALKQRKEKAEKEKSEKSGETLVVEKGDEHKSPTESSKKVKETTNVNETKVEAMEVVES